MGKLGKDFISEQEVNFAISDSIETKGIDVEEFYKQLEEFYKDGYYKQRFKKCSLSNKIGIEIFKFQPNRSLKSKLLTVDLTGSLMSVDNVFESTHIAKVIKLPKDSSNYDYSEGDLVIMSYSDTVGQDINPDYAFLLQFSQSNMEPKMPKSVPPFTHRYVAKPYKIIGKYEI